MDRDGQILPARQIEPILKFVAWQKIVMANRKRQLHNFLSW